MTWLTGWNRRKQITVNGSTGGAQSDYQMKLTVNQASGTDSPGIVYLGGNVLTTFNDLRFTKSDGSTPLNYWIESITGTSPNQIATVWIKLAPSPDTIPVSPGTYNFYIYYNNTGATSATNGENTFVLFDDFSGNLSKWTVGASARVAILNGEMEIYGNNAGNAFGNHYVIGNQTIPRPAIVEWDSHTIQSQSDATEGIVANASAITSWNTGAGNLLFMKNYDANGLGLDLYFNNAKVLDVGPYVKANKVPSKIDLPLTQGFKMYYNGNLVYTDTTAVFDNWKFTAAPWQGADYVYIDNFRVRKYASPEPTFSTTGTEEQGITAYSMSLNTNTCTGTCQITATITWQNLGNSNVTFRPKILIDGTTYVQAVSDTTIGPYPEISSSIQITTDYLSIGTHSVCPYPN